MNIHNLISITIFFLSGMISPASAADLTPQKYSLLAANQIPLQNNQATQTDNHTSNIQQQLNSMSEKEKALFRSMNEMSQTNKMQRSDSRQYKSSRQQRRKSRGKHHENEKSRYGIGYEARQNNQQNGRHRGRF